MNKVGKALISISIIAAAAVAGVTASTAAIGSSIWPEPKPHEYAVNANNETFGIAAGNTEDPDLIAAIGDDGRSGYVRSEDLLGPTPKSPAEAVEATETLMAGKSTNERSIPLYKEDGTTVIGTFTLETQITAESSKE